jgi:uncharacterized membrane protein YesL
MFSRFLFFVLVICILVINILYRVPAPRAFEFRISNFGFLFNIIVLPGWPG